MDTTDQKMLLSEELYKHNDAVQVITEASKPDQTAERILQLEHKVKHLKLENDKKDRVIKQLISKMSRSDSKVSKLESAIRQLEALLRQR